MFKLKWNTSKLKQLEKKMNAIADGLTSDFIEDALTKVLSDAQANAIRLSSEDESKILIDVVEVSSGRVKGRVYTSKENFSYAPFLEYGTGQLAEMPHIGTTATFLKTQYAHWFIPVAKVEKELHYPIVEIQGVQFYFAHSVKSRPFMRPTAEQIRITGIDTFKEDLKKLIREVCK